MEIDNTIPRSLEFIEPSKPIQNAFGESYNGRMRDERPEPGGTLLWSARLILAGLA